MAFGYGQQGPLDSSSEFNSLTFLVNQILSRVRTFVPVKVVEATDGAVGIPGIVAVQPMVNMLDGNSNATEHGQIFNVPVFRLQAGGRAIILDPMVGDIGWLAICDRDISSVKATRAVANPGSLRRFDLADGVYFGGGLNGAPTDYLWLTPTEIKIVSVAKVEIQAPVILLNGAVQLEGSVTGPAGGAISIAVDILQTAGDFTTAGSVSASAVEVGNIGLTTHRHAGVTTGGGTSGTPVV